MQALLLGTATPFIYGERGTGKTSLALSAALDITKSDRHPLYVACSPGMAFSSLAREVLIGLSDLTRDLGVIGKKTLKSIEATLSLSPALKFTWDQMNATSANVEDASHAVRLLVDFDRNLPDPKETVVVVDELENLAPASKGDLAFFVKQLGDQEVKIRFILVGIGRNIQDLIGAHPSTPRYVHDVFLDRLKAQSIIDIAKTAADAIPITIPENILYRVVAVADGYPHFAHLIALHVLSVAIVSDAKEIDNGIYNEGLQEAVEGGLEGLAGVYEKAVMRGEQIYKYILWTMADSNMLDQMKDDIINNYENLSQKHRWGAVDVEGATTALQRLKTSAHGEIIKNTPQRTTGTAKKVYRYVRFSEPLMRAYVRLRAENEGVQLGPENSRLPNREGLTD